MRRIALLVVSTSALAGFSHAAYGADLGTMRPYAPYAPAAYISPAPSWTGWYLGGNIGYAWGHARSNANVPGFSVDTGAPAGVIDIPGFSSSETSTLNSLTGGFQSGFNWQVAPRWVLGVEADFQRAAQKASQGASDTFASTVLLPDVGAGDCPCGVSGSSSLHYETELKWFGTLRGRAGYVANNLLFYGTGGLAYGQLQVNGRNSSNVTVTDDSAATVFTDTFASSFSKSQWKMGWTAGAGVEGMAWDPHWTWKAEYLYLDLGKAETSAGAAGGGTIKVSTKFTDHIARLGLNYRF